MFVYKMRPGSRGWLAAEGEAARPASKGSGMPTLLGLCTDVQLSGNADFVLLNATVIQLNSHYRVHNNLLN